MRMGRDNDVGGEVLSILFTIVVIIASCLFLSVIKKQHTTIRDLKARLEAAREHIERTCPRAFLSSDKCSCGECTAHNAADLTIKNWRKP